MGLLSPVSVWPAVDQKQRGALKRKQSIVLLNRIDSKTYFSNLKVGTPKKNIFNIFCDFHCRQRRSAGQAELGLFVGIQMLYGKVPKI